jgi:hypothetical protein
MITKNEVSTLNFSPTKKDFVQIWNELIDVAGKISARWDPTSTNESDPGIVLLKALAGIADKLNYNIDKNTLEAFMPTAAQEESMRKLTEMMGYNMKYLRSATTTVKVTYHNPDPSEEEKQALDAGLLLPSFTVVRDETGTINYFTTNPLPVYISSTTPTITLDCMEGQIVKCESLNDNNVITRNLLTTDNRFYLPEVQIAENGIFIYNTARNLKDQIEAYGEAWARVDNLNTQKNRSRVFKFGYDSYLGRTFVEFPEDISELIGDGLLIYYTRTSGESGNIASGTLKQMEIPSDWTAVSQDSFQVENIEPSNNGANIESISSAYKNFKKTIGTFDTLVTCRDYMNSIYNMMSSDNKPLVSKALVTDIRNDLNKAITICSCSDAGICYKEKPVTKLIPKTVYMPVFVGGCWHLIDEKGPILTESTMFLEGKGGGFKFNDGGIVTAGEKGFWEITQTGMDGEQVVNRVFTTKLKTLVEKEELIDHFDLVLYPFKSYNQIKNNVLNISSAYNSSFEYTERSLPTIEARLRKSQTLAHKYTKPSVGDILCINNYLRLNAFIATTNKISADEGAFIIDKVKIALANAFNLRELDFGEEIPFEQILEVIEKADPRIKLASLAEPALYTTYSVLGGYSGGNPKIFEYATASEWLTGEEAARMPKFVDEEYPYSTSSATFFAEQISSASPASYKFYTYINNIKKYLSVQMVSTGRKAEEDELDLTPFLTFDEDGVTWSRYQATGASKPAWIYTYTVDKDHSYSYFLGAYGDSDKITISDIKYLKGSSAANEYPAEFAEAAHLKGVTRPVITPPTACSTITENTPYKLFVQNMTLKAERESEGENPQAVTFALSETSENQKHLLSTAVPENDGIAYKQRYLFNTKTAKTIYNKLALRNVLAGRVPLFNYNETYKTDFDQASYRITVQIKEENAPEELTALKNVENAEYPAFVVKSDDQYGMVTYAVQETLVSDESTEKQLVYTKTYTPIVSEIIGKFGEVIKELYSELEILGDPVQEEPDNSEDPESPNPDTGETPPSTDEGEGDGEGEEGSGSASGGTSTPGQSGNNSGASSNSGKTIKHFTVKDVTLPEGQTIRFRAPNFITKVTYPAYVNYHLQLNDPLAADARPAAGDSLLNILNYDLNQYNYKSGANESSNGHTDINWEKAFNYFRNKQASQDVINSSLSDNNKKYFFKRFKISQEFNAFSSEENGPPLRTFCGCSTPNFRDLQEGEEGYEQGYKKCQNANCGGFSVDQYIAPEAGNPNYSFSLNISAEDTAETPALEEILRESGIIRFRTSGEGAHTHDKNGIKITFTAKDKNASAADKEKVAKFSDHFGFYFNLDYANDANGRETPFINSADIIYALQDTIDQKVGYWKQCRWTPEGATASETVLPDVAWKVELNFEYIPLNKTTIDEWQTFLLKFVDLDRTKNPNPLYFPESSIFSQNNAHNRSVFVNENNNIFWRKYSGYNYEIGAYVDNTFSKYLPFEKTTLDSMTFDSVIGNTFILGDIGADGETTIISNGSEYQLQTNEYLYINYTPSSTDAEGNTQKGEPKNIVYGPGTIIRPAGFEEGLIDSTYKESMGTSWTKRNIKFPQAAEKTTSGRTSQPVVNLHSLGANEQIEIREWSRVVLNRKKLNENPRIFVYKDFDNDLLESAGSKKVVQYTLKEREHIFYTDEAKADAGVFGPGTTVTLRRVSIPRAEKVDLQTILDHGLDKADWKGVDLTGNKEIEFTEYQYFTLGEGDTLISAEIIGYDTNAIDGTWKPCIWDRTRDVKYTLASSTEEPKTTEILPRLSTAPVLDSTNTLLKQANKASKFYGWEVCCESALNVSPEQPQALTSIFDGATMKISNKLTCVQQGAAGGLDTEHIVSAEDIVDNINKSEDEQEVITLPKIYYLTNVLCQNEGTEITISDILNYVWNKLDLTSFSLKFFSHQPPMLVKTLYGKPFPYRSAAEELDTSVLDVVQTWEGTEVQTKDPTDIWSRVNLDDIKVGITSPDSPTGIYDKALKLSVLVLPNTYGITSLYTNYTSELLGTAESWIEIPAGYAEDDFVILNTEPGQSYWNIYEGKQFKEISTGVNRLYLLPGLNCLKIKKSCDLIIKTSLNSQGEFYFDTLRLVQIEDTGITGNPHTQGINLKQIGYFFTDDTSETSRYSGSEIQKCEQQLLKDIRELDTDRDFYYNVPVETSISLEFSSSNDSKNTLANPRLNYDVNNVNNSFVVSKLDIDYLDTGLQIARSSKLG